MAKKKNFKLRNQKKDAKKVPFYKDERFKVTLGLALIFFSLFMTLSFISYLFTWQADQSFEFQETISPAEIKANNWAGKLGADLAYVFITRWFGIAGFSIPFLIFLVGLKLINLRILPFWKTLKNTLISTVLISIVLGYLFANAGGYLGSGLGGNHGYFISQWLNSFLGKVGTAFVLLIAVSVYIIFTYQKSLTLAKSFIRKLKESSDTEFKDQNLINPEDIVQKETSTANNETEISKTEIIVKDEIKETINSEVTNSSESTPEPENKENIAEDDDFTISTFAEDNSSAEENNGFEIEIKTQKDDQPEITENPEEEELFIDHGVKEDLDNSKRVEMEDYDPTLDLAHYKLPLIDLLEDHRSTEEPISDAEIIANKNKIVETLANYKIQIDKIKATVGPTVTLYEIIPAPGVRISKIKNLEDDIALSLAALGIRIIAPIPGKGTIGIEVPNPKPEIVSMKSVIQSSKFRDAKHELAVGLGKTIQNETFVVDLAKMPHLLVAGATGQGKSVGLNAILASLLYKKHPSQLKFVLVDPKKVELTLYSKIEKHFLAKLPDTEEAIITDTQKVINTLNSLCMEMDSRYELLKVAHVRNIKEYNAKFTKRKLNPEKGHRFLPYIVVVIDEFADLIMTAGREVETPIARLAQLARAIGIHLIIATQRPTTNIITGVIKANFPARIAFRVTAMVDSRTILDSPGANQLIGRGDMLISQGSDLVRVQCAFVDTPEIEKIVDYIADQQGYPTALELPEYTAEGDIDIKDVDLNKKDALFEDAARLMVASQQGSTSMIQRKFSIGYNRAGRIVDQLEAAGVVGQFEGSKARQVLIPDDYSLEQLLNNLS